MEHEEGPGHQASRLLPRGSSAAVAEVSHREDAKRR